MMCSYYNRRELEEQMKRPVFRAIEYFQKFNIPKIFESSLFRFKRKLCIFCVYATCRLHYSSDSKDGVASAILGG